MKKFISLILMLLTLAIGQMWGADNVPAPAGTYNLVTDASTLAAGDVIIITGTAASGTGYAISTTQNSNNRGQASVTISNNSITIPANTTVQGITLEAGTTSGTLSFKVGDNGYLYAASSSSNYLRTESKKSANSSWTISISSNDATITAQGSNSRKRMRHNSGSSLFACYATDSNTGTLVRIFKKAAASCDKKVALTKGSEANGTFTLSNANASYDNCDANFVVTVSNIVPASNANYCNGIDVTGGNSSVSGPVDGVYTVTYTKGNNITSTITPTYAAKTQRTVTFMNNGVQYGDVRNLYDGDAVGALPSDPSSCATGKIFVGWSETEIGVTPTDVEPTFITASTIVSGSNKVYHAVFATATQGEDEVLSQTLLYDTWSYRGTTTDKTNYRLFGNNAYVESASFDLSTLSKVIVYGGTYGGGTYNSLTIGDGTHTWKSVTVSGDSQTGTNTYTGGTALSGTGTLRIISNSGNGTGSGIRISQVKIYTIPYEYSGYITGCCQPLGTINGSVSVTQTSAVVKLASAYAQAANADAYQLKVEGSSNYNTWTDVDKANLTTSVGVTVNGLTCGTAYTAYLRAKGSGSYCEYGTESHVDFTTSKYSITRSGDPAGTVTGGTFTTKIGNDAVTEACNGSTINIAATPANGYQFSSWSINNGAVSPAASAATTTFSMPSADVTITASFSCVTPTFGTNLSTERVDYLVGEASPAALTVAASANNATINYQWQTSPDNSAWTNTGTNAPENTSITPSTNAAGTTYYRCIATNAASGCSANKTSAVAMIVVTAPSGYCISAFNSSNDAITSGFNNGGEGNEYTLSYTIPGKDGSSNWPQYWIGENEAWASFSANANFADMQLLAASGSTLGLAEGATGTLHIWDNNKEAGSNLWVKFEPSGYGLRWGSHENADWSAEASTKAFTVDAGDANTYWTEMVTLDGTNNSSWDYYVGLQSASGYVYSGVDNESSDTRGISRTRSVTTMKVSNGTAGQYKATYLDSEPAGTTGKFRIWNNNIEDYNFVCHWVPFYQLTYNGNGAAGSVAASDYICCEESAANRTIQAASNGFTVPTGKQFAGWATSAANATAGTVAYAAGADIVLTSDVELFPVWTDIDYTVAVEQSPSAGATLSGATSTAHYGVTINISTDVPSGYRFVNWTSNDVEFVDATATSTSFTMPNGNVTVTANYQAVCTVKWYVGGTTEDKKVAETTVDAGSKVVPPTDPLGTAIGDCANTFMGWTTSTYRNGSVPRTADYYETPLFKKATASASLPTITENTSYYAVFATNDLDGEADITIQHNVPSTGTSTNMTGGNDAETFFDLDATEWSIVSAKGGASNHVGINKDGNMRLYYHADGGSTITVSLLTGANIISAEIEYGGGDTYHNGYVKVGNNTITPSEGVYSINATSFVIGNANTSSTQVYIKKVDVKYSAPSITNYVTECAAVEAPTFSVDPADGPFNEAQSVTITSETDDAKVYYTKTTDGSTPADPTADDTEATSAITVDQNTKIKAIAIKGEHASDIVSAEYTFKVVTPEITSSPKHFLSKTNVSIASTTGATIYYTTDGSTPTTESGVYSAPFEISANATITAYAVKSGWTDSEKSESVTFTKVNEEDILTVDQARSVIDGGSNLNNRYVHGKIYNVASYNSTHHSITYWISDEGTGSTSSKDGLQVYGGLAGDYKDQFTEVTDLAEGDEVIVWGNLLKFGNNAPYTYELNVNNEIAKLMRDVVAPAFTPVGGGFLDNVHVTIASEEGATIYYTTDGTEPTNESTLYTNAGIDLSATTTIKAIAYKDEYNSVVITKKYTKGGTPLTVAQALEALDSNDPIDDQFVSGKVCTAPASAPSNGQLTYYIVDDLDNIQNNNKLQVYKGKDLGGANFDAQADIQFGDVVTVFGQLKIHQGTKELNENNHLVAFDRPTYLVTEVSVDPTSATIEKGHTVDLTATVLPTYATDKSVEWSSSASGVASVENGVVTGVSYGTAVITVTAQDGSNVAANCTITVYQWNLDGYEVTSAPATEYTEVDHFSKASVAIQANYVRSDNPELTQDEDVAASAWSAKLGGNAIADNYQFQLADDGKSLALYVGENKVWEETISVAEAPKDQFVVGIWDVAAPEEQNGTYTMPSLSDQTAAEGNCKDHNIFVGWVAEENADDLIDDNIIAGGATGIVASNTTYHAVWAKQITGPRNFSIKYDWDGSTTGWGTSGTWSSNDNGKSGKCGSVSSTESIYTISSYAKPKTFSVSLKRTSGNTTNSWKIQYSKNNSTWTDIETINFSSISNSDWSTLISVDVSAEDYENSYFKLVKSGNANCLVDDVTLVYEANGTYNTDYRVDCSQRYTLSFDANGGSGSYDAVEKREDAVVTLPDGSALSLEFFDFAGWKVYYAGTETEITVTNNQFTMPASNVEAVAQWTEQAKGTISYVGDEITNSSITRYAGQTYNLRSNVTLPANKQLVGWTIEGDETLYAPNQQMTMPTPVQDITYHAQILDVLPKPSGIDLSNGEWILVTNENQLQAGDFVVIVGNETSYAVGAQGNNIRDVAGVTKNNDGTKITLSEGVAKFFLQHGYMDDEYALYDITYVANDVVGGYLYANSNTANQINTSATYSNRNYSWKITITDNVATVEAQGTNSHNVLQYNYNQGSPRFAGYTGSMTNVQLYRFEGQKKVEITEDVNTSEIYLNNADVTVKDGGVLTIGNDKTIGDLNIEAGGHVSVAEDQTLTVNDFTIESAAGKSGQLIQGEDANVQVTGDIYMDVKFYSAATLDETSANQWYMISAPFAVNLNGGFLQTDGTPMVFGQDFDLFYYDGQKRANTGTTGWTRVQGQMPAGRACLIGFNEGQSTTIRLKAASNVISDPTSITLSSFAGDVDNANWNGVANPRMRYTSVDKDVQIWNNEEGENGRKYITYGKDDFSFVVGTPFFVQATGEIDLTGSLNGSLRAPKREDTKRYSYRVQITREGATEFADQMYVRASEEATNTYEQGHDMITWNGTSGKSALLWAENYGMRLAIEEAPLTNNTASYVLGIYAPANGTYTISVPTEREDANLYLTKNGQIIWNLSMSPYEVELTKGTTNEYGLKIVAAPQVITDIEQSTISDQPSVQKVIIDEHVFILRGEQLFDVTGKAVK